MWVLLVVFLLKCLVWMIMLILLDFLFFNMVCFILVVWLIIMIFFEFNSNWCIKYVMSVCLLYKCVLLNIKICLFLFIYLWYVIDLFLL